MPVTTANLIAGPATLYIGAYGATEPADTAVNSTPATSAWTDLGATQDGLTLAVNMEFFELEVDQVIWVMERRNSKIDPRVKTNLAEATLENFKYAMNSVGTAASGSGYKSFVPDVANSATQPTYVALIVDGWAPMVSGAGKRRRVILRKCLQMGNIETAYKKAGQTLFPVEFGIHYIDSSTTPLKIIDQTT